METDDFVRFCKLTVTNGYKFGVDLRYKISEISSVSASVASSGRCVEPPDGILSRESSEIKLDEDEAGVNGLGFDGCRDADRVVVAATLPLEVAVGEVVRGGEAVVDRVVNHADAVDGAVVVLVVDQADGCVDDGTTAGIYEVDPRLLWKANGGNSSVGFRVVVVRVATTRALF